MHSALARAGGAASTSSRCRAAVAHTWLAASTACARRAHGGPGRRRPGGARVAAVAMPQQQSSASATTTAITTATPRRPPPPPPTPVPRGATPPGGWSSIGTSPTGAAFVVDKPAGWTSFDVCAALRSALGVKRVGHAGTLDPLATGVLVVCAGKATKAVPAFTDADKEYTGVLRLGEATPTLDAGSPVDATAAWHHVTDAALQAAAADLTGPAVIQRVPMYSAIKVGGSRLYAAARAGVDVADRPVRAVRVDAFEVTRLGGGGGYTPPPGEAAAAAREIARIQARAARAAAEAAVVAAGMSLPDKKQRQRRQRRRRRKQGGDDGGAEDPVEAAIESALASLPPPPPPPPPVDPPGPGPHGCRDVAFRVACAKGTYVRTLAADLGAAVGSAAHVVALRRTRVGRCGVEQDGVVWGVEELVAAAREGRRREEEAAGGSV